MLGTGQDRPGDLVLRMSSMLPPPAPVIIGLLVMEAVKELQTALDSTNLTGD